LIYRTSIPPTPTSALHDSLNLHTRQHNVHQLSQIQRRESHPSLPHSSTKLTPPQATVEDLEPPAALSIQATDPISHALMCAFERDYTHLTVISHDTRALLGYISIPKLKSLLEAHAITEADPVERAMQKFRRTKGNPYRVITLDTPLEELEEFFEGGGVDGRPRQEFAVVTDEKRKFVLGVAMRDDLEEFVKRRPT